MAPVLDVPAESVFVTVRCACRCTVVFVPMVAEALTDPLWTVTFRGGVVTMEVLVCGTVESA